MTCPPSRRTAAENAGQHAAGASTARSKGSKFAQMSGWGSQSHLTGSAVRQDALAQLQRGEHEAAALQVCEQALAWF